jgi:pimeloyl-ACP methyl ester carboxylesterase
MKKAFMQVVVMALCVMYCCVLAEAAPEDNGPYTYTKYTRSIPARDGGSISTCVFVTSAAGPRPLIVFRHGFARSKDVMKNYGKHWGTRGFVVILNDSRTGLSPDYTGKDSNDMIDCANWAVQQSDQAGNYLSGKINPTKVVLGGHSAGGYTAEIATYKNLTLGEGNFDCAVMVLYDPVPTDDDYAATIAQRIFIPSVMIYGVPSICNLFGAGKVIFQNTAGPSYGIYVKAADHCDFESYYTLSCAILCFKWPFGGWDRCKNSRVKRYGTAMIEAYLNCDPAAYPYIDGSAAQSDTSIKIYPESRGLSMPPDGCF